MITPCKAFDKILASLLVFSQTEYVQAITTKMEPALFRLVIQIAKDY